MSVMERRRWVPWACEDRVQSIARTVAGAGTAAIARRIGDLVEENRVIHDRTCFNLNPAANVMNPRAELLLAAGLGSRPSLGYPGDKHESGLEAIEQIEVIAAQLACRVFRSRFAEVRVASGALANLYVYMAVCRPGDVVIAPPASLGGHVSHHAAGAAGRYGLQCEAAPADPATGLIDTDALRDLARRVRPALITLGGSFALVPQPVRAIREIAAETGARVLYDAAHLCGPIAGGEWPDPLADGADVVTMSTYKSLGGPPGGLIVTNDAELAERLDAVAFPGLTANFDVARVAALAVTLLDWIDFGAAYARAMRDTARALEQALAERGVPMFGLPGPGTGSHQCAILAAGYGDGHAASKHLRRAGILASGIGLPRPPVPGGPNGIRLGTPEIVRRGMRPEDMPLLADIIAVALGTERPEELAPVTADLRRRFDGLHFMHAGD